MGERPPLWLALAHVPPHHWRSSPFSVHWLIRMDKMLKTNASVSISSIYCVGFTDNFLQSFAVLYITVCINCEGPELYMV